jgi:hypothetical protein
MASYTENYALTKPTMAESADIRVINSNMDTVDDVMHSTQVSLAPAYDMTETYNTGDVVMYELLMYECLEDEVTGTWDATKWQRTTAGEHGGGSDVEVTQIQTEGKAVASIAVDGVSTDILVPELKVYGEASGDLITIEDAMEAPLAKLEVGIEAVQSGSGEPSPQNVRPIVGKNAINVLNLDLPNGNYMASDRQISFAWEDGDTEYDMPFNVMANETVKDSSDNDVDVLTLESEYVLPFDTVYDAPEAIYASANDLSAGDYYFKIVNDSWGGNNGKYVSFTIDTILTAGKQIRKSSGSYNVSIEDCTLAIYDSGASTSGTALDFTVSTTQPSSGTDLGQTDGTADLNYWHCVVLGYNRWKYSAIRQFLNSDQAKGNWWVQQHKWDVMPSYATTADGFLKVMDPAVLAHIKTTEVKTARNTVFNSGDTPLGGFDTTFDKIFLAALEQMYIQPQESGEGTYWPYYKELLNVNSPVARGATYPELKKYDLAAKTTSRSRWLRSCYRGDAGTAWYVHSSGYVTSTGATNAFRCAPCLRIGVNKKDTVNLGNTYYGGTLDVTSGVLTVTHKLLTMSDITWLYSDSLGLFYATLSDYKKTSTTVKPNAECEIFNVVGRNKVLTDRENGLTFGNVGEYDNRILVRESSITDLSTFESTVNGKKLVYELATPQEIQLTPTEVTLLRGINNLWSDGEMYVKYRRDIEMLLQRIADSLGGSNA